MEVAISAVTAGELYEGAHRSFHPAGEVVKAERFLAPIEVLPLGHEEAREWGLIEAELRKAGKPIEAEDGMIAATARRHGLTLVTGNLKHFSRIDGLLVVDWEKHPPRARVD